MAKTSEHTRFHGQNRWFFS